MASHTQRTLAHLKEQGLHCAIAEHWCSFTHQRKDLFGFIDIIALDEGEKRIIAVQSFGADFQPHYRKVTEKRRESALKWLKTGNPILLVGWRKLKKKNKDGKWSKQGYWKPRLYWMTEADFILSDQHNPSHESC